MGEILASSKATYISLHDKKCLCDKVQLLVIISEKLAWYNIFGDTEITFDCLV